MEEINNFEDAERFLENYNSDGTPKTLTPTVPSLSSIKTNNEQQLILNTSPQILITPCAKTKKKYGPCSRTDWEEQMSRGDRFEQMMWDDSSRNVSQTGDIFILCRNNISVSFHKIENILSPVNRLSSWAKNIGQSDRNVIYISPQLTTMKWDEWLALGGAKKVQGTTAVIQGKTKILNALRIQGILK
jgi:hypothetical protein